MITTTIQNAALLLSALGKQEDFKLKTFCETRKLSLHYMEQIGRKLVIAKIIGSKRGPGGGYHLIKEKVTVTDVIMAVTDSKKNTENCKLTKAVMTALESITITKLKNSKEENCDN